MKNFLLLLLCGVALSLNAQAPATWGAKMGINLSQHYGTKADEGDYEVKTGLRPGVIAGVYLDFAANDVLTLGFEALYSMKGSFEEIRISKMELDGQMEELQKPATMDVKYFVDYLEIPVLLKLKALKFKNIDLYAVTGTAMGIKVKGYHELQGTVWFPDGDGDFSQIPIYEESKLKQINLFDFSFVYGGILDLKERWPLSLEYRFTLGWDYLYLPTYDLFDPVALRNQTWSLILSTSF